MLYALIVKPILLALLAGTLWVVWRAGDGFDGAGTRRHRRWTGLAAAVIALLVLGPPVWGALTEQPAEVLRWIAIGALVLAAGWGYTRLLGAARRRARPPGDE